MLCQLLLNRKMHQWLHIHNSTLSDSFLTGHCGALRTVPCAGQQVLTSDLFYILQCVHANPNLPVYPFLPGGLSLSYMIFPSFLLKIHIVYVDLTHPLSQPSFLLYPEWDGEQPGMTGERVLTRDRDFWNKRAQLGG